MPKLKSLSFLTFLVIVAVIVFTGKTWSQGTIGRQLIEKEKSKISQHVTNEDLKKTNSSHSIKSVETNPLGEAEFLWKRPSVITQAIALSLLSISPFLIMLLTSFAKISIVSALLRNALGTQQAPPNQVINGVSLILTMFIMFPVGLQMYDAALPVINDSPPKALISSDAAVFLGKVGDAAKEPFRDFLRRNTSIDHQKRFYRIAYRIAPEEFRSSLEVHSFLVLMPAFITTQLKEAFEIGVLIYLPFFVIDLVTSNILLAMGMMMLSPVTISLPLKIFLLVMLDGWTLLIQGLIETYH